MSLRSDVIRCLKKMFPPGNIVFYHDLEEVSTKETEYCNSEILYGKELIIFQFTNQGSDLCPHSDLSQHDIALDWTREPNQMEGVTLSLFEYIKYKVHGWYLVDCPNRVGAFILTTQENISPYYKLGLSKSDWYREDRPSIEEKSAMNAIQKAKSLTNKDKEVFTKSVLQALKSIKSDICHAKVSQDETLAQISYYGYALKREAVENDKLKREMSTITTTYQK